MLIKARPERRAELVAADLLGGAHLDQLAMAGDEADSAAGRARGGGVTTAVNCAIATAPSRSALAKRPVARASRGFGGDDHGNGEPGRGEAGGKALPHTAEALARISHR